MITDREPIRLWGRTSGFHARKVIWALQELNLRFTLTEAGFGILPTDEFLSRNPNALAPTIDDHGVVLWESNVIVRYLCARYASGNLMPEDLAERFAAEQWMDWNATTLWPALRPLFRESVRGEALPQEDKDRAMAELSRWLDVLENQLRQTPYLAGAVFSMANIPAGLTIERWFGLGLDDGARPQISRWRQALTARPAFPHLP